ncbi:MAG: transglycosylase SLT domain-containing protein, partial [Myxococcota bacterium]
VDPAPTLDGIRAHLEAGDADRALRMAERAVAAWPASRSRDAAWMVVGVVNHERGRHGRASDAFGEVRAGKGPLAPLAGYLQADQEYLRGEPARAVALCANVAGPHAGDCLRIRAASHAALGRVAEARAAAAAYDKDHPTGPIGEQIELAIAEHLVDSDPAAAIPIYAALAVRHGAALTGRVAEERLAELQASGHPSARIPDDLESRKQRALSLREAGRRDPAWELFDALRGEPGAADWVKEETERFGWQTQRWSFLEQEYAAEYARTNDPELAWKRYRVLARAGRFDDAATLGVQMQAKAGNAGHWRKSEDEIGRTMLLAKRYPEARAQFDVVVGRGGWSGRRAAFSAAFAAYMAGELDDAVRRFDSITVGDEAHAPEARYWRSKALDRLGRGAEAAADRAWLTTEEPWSWYAGLVAQADPARPTIEPYARAGRWVGTDPPRDPGPLVLNLSVTDPAPSAPGLPTPVAARARDLPAGFAGWTSDGLVTELLSTPSDPFLPPEPPSWELEPPSSYRPGTLHVPERSRAALAAFADEYGAKWPELNTVVDLASVGLYDLSGPTFNDWYERWREAVRKRDKVAKKLVATTPEAWRDLFLAARDHNNTARNLWGAWETLTDPAQVAEAWRLAYPLAHDRYVWSHAREHDLDPYLVLGLMRQESTYNATARSRVGARGAMQIMPRTGHLLADLQHDTTFDAGDLEDPTVAVGYGIRYLGLLLDRFDGVFPLAVASYNAGPFNVSNWLQGVRANPADPTHPVTVPIDEFVEHIPYRETRDYVKKVTEGYSAYIDMYTPAGSRLIVPPAATADRREVVDF